MANWREELAAYIKTEAKPVEKFGHQPRLYVLTREIGAGQQYDDDVVYAAVWLHDLGVFTGHRPEDPVALAAWNNTAYAVDRAPVILGEMGFPAEKVPAVLECIQNHQPSGDPETVESTILRDADILEQLGAVGILRTVCKVGRDTRFQTFTQAVASLQKAHDQLQSQLRLPVAKELGVDRILMLREFLSAVRMEAQQNLF